MTRMQMLFEAPGFVRSPKLTMADVMRLGPTERAVLGGTRLRIEDLPADDAVLGALGAAVDKKQKVLVTGHVEPTPDGDAVGSTLALVRTLRALGVDARACFATAHIRGELRAIATDEELVDLADLKKEGFVPDLVVMSDVADAKQIGGVAELVKTASSVAIVDHHHVFPTSETLGLGPSQTLHRWIYPGGDSASGMIGGLIAELLRNHPQREEILADAALPLAAGILTDTRYGERHAVSQLSLHLCRDLIERFLGGDLEALKTRLQYVLPDEASALLLGDKGLGARRYAKIMGETLDVSTVSHAVFSEALALTRKQDPKALPEDLLGPMLEILDARAFGSRASTLTALLIELEGPEKIVMSLRAGRPNLARQVAELLGGGGKVQLAGARASGSLENTEKELAAALQQTLVTTLKVKSW